MSASIRIGGASGFWGDSAIAAPQLLGGGRLDFLVFDYLAEITMSILARARAEDPAKGYAADFIAVMADQLPALKDQGVKVIANAGGVNPLACARALEAVIAERGYDLRVGVVLGDGILSKVDALRAAGVTEMFNGASFPEKVLSANVYLGAFPIAEALDLGADIVVTGRCVDAAVTLGAAIHRFGWSVRDVDKLAAGALAGHIIECGAQATGGLHTDWALTGDWANIGYPIAEIWEDGAVEISKPPNTGGLVSFGSVAEQLVYEIGDPAAYLLPDVTCDFSNVKIEEVGKDRVRVTGAKGRAPTNSYKATITYNEGFRVGCYLTLVGIDAVRKAEKVADAVLRRCEAMLRARDWPPYSETSIEVVGGESFYGAQSRARDSREVMLKLAAKHEAPKALDMLIRELTSAGTSMAPGITMMGGNRPKVSPIVRLFSCLVDKGEIAVEVRVGDDVAMLKGAPRGDDGASGPSAASAFDALTLAPCTHSARLIELAFARSGDKGNNANIGVIARKASYLSYIRRALTEDVVAACFAHFLKGRVERFDLPGIGALNFVLHDVLGGGGVASLRGDPQGKTYAQILLDTDIPISSEIARDLRAGDTPP